MNLLKDDFISTTQGKVSLKTILTTDVDYQLQYYFDEIQLAMLQLLGSLTTALLRPTTKELKRYLKEGVTEEQYDRALKDCNSEWFEADCFMQSRPVAGAKWHRAGIHKMVSGIESSTTKNASGLFSEIEQINAVCSDCIHGLNYNLHMNIKSEYFGKTGSTGIRGGGVISTLVSGKSIKQTLLNNTIAIDAFCEYAELNSNAENSPMWILQPTTSMYLAPTIGLIRGLFALAYHISFQVDNKPCCCDVCGHHSDQTVKQFNREKYSGHYGSTKTGRDGGAGWWPHPFTPITIKPDGVYAVCARDQNWQSWQELGSYIVGKETDKATTVPAYVVRQHQAIENPVRTNLLVGGNVVDQASITGRVYDLYSMPSTLSRQLSRVTQVVDAGLEQKERLSQALNKMFGVGYDKNFVGGIKEQAMHRFTANAQQIIQQTLLDVDRKEATELRKQAAIDLKKEAKTLFAAVQRKYQHDLPLFKALVKGESVLNRK